MNQEREQLTAEGPISFRRILKGSPILPLLVIDDAEVSRTLMTTLLSCGIKVAEIALRTESSLLALKMAAEVPGICVGAGTVLTVRQVDEVADVGAKFIVCPSFDEDVVVRARELGLPVLPGVATASEVQRAVKTGLDLVKFFPADSLGGLRAIDSLAGVFPGMQFVPSGGISESNFESYLEHSSVAAVSGSWLAPRALIQTTNFAEITIRTKNAVSALKP